MASLQASYSMNRLPESRLELDVYGEVTREFMWGRFVANQLGASNSTWSTAPFGYDQMFAQTYAQTPGTLLCPSAVAKETLSHIPERVGVVNSRTVSTETSDYRGSLGVFDPLLDSRAGAFSIKKDRSPLRPMSALLDGASNTVFAWETIGAKRCWLDQRTRKLTFLPWIDADLQGRWPVDFELRHDSTYSPRSSLDGYFLGWSGFSSGALFVESLGSLSGGAMERRFLNGNAYGSPYSLHPTGINIANADGSVHLMSRSIDFEVLANRIDIDDGKTLTQDE
jgi:hypothetical protein